MATHSGPAFLVVPSAIRYGRGNALASSQGFELHHAPPSTYPTLCIPWLTAPLPIVGRDNDLPVIATPFETLTLKRRAYRRQEHRSRWERRREARRGHKGRRGATAVPYSTRWTVEIYAGDDVPERLLCRWAEEHAAEGTIETCWERQAREGW